MLKNLTVKDFVYELASDSPAPGGGSVAALCGAIAAALAEMVANLTVGREKYKDSQEVMEKVHHDASQLKDKFLTLMEKDTESFNVFMAARKLPKETEAEKEARAQAIELASQETTLVPLETLESCVQLAELALCATLNGNPNAISDGGVAGLLAIATAKGAAYNVRINIPGIKDQAFSAECQKRLKNALNRVTEISMEIEAKVDSTL